MILTFGPFVGDFESEITVFRPYVKWIIKTIGTDNVYVSTHRNRFFLYDYLPQERLIPVYENFSRDELSQYGYIHLSLSKKDYMLLLRKFKTHISSITDGDKIENFHLHYTKTNQSWYPIYNRTFEKIKETKEAKIKESNYIVFIPDGRETEETLRKIYSFIEKRYNVVVIGDMKTCMPDKNVILKKTEYFENGYKLIVNYILNAKAVLCPVSHWTLLCNLHKIPVFSWGNNITQYCQSTGIYNFGNKKSSMLLSNNVTHITEGILNFLERP